MMKNKITQSDFKLRLFLDTNVLINYFSNHKGNITKAAINLLSKTKNIELVTSEYVLWEFYGFFRKELFARKLVNIHKHNLISANKDSSNERYDAATYKDMECFGVEIAEYKKKLDGIVCISPVFDKSNEDINQFDTVVEKLLQCSKFSYKDSIVVASALFTRSHMLITGDTRLANEEHLNRLKRALSDLPKSFTTFSFKSINNLSNKKLIRKEYKKWFDKYNSKKEIGEVTEHYTNKKVVKITSKNILLSRKYSYYLIRFDADNKLSVKYLKRIRNADNFRDFKTKQPIEKSKEITIKLPKNTSNLKKHKVFIAE